MGRQGKLNHDTHWLRPIVAILIALASFAEPAASGPPCGFLNPDAWLSKTAQMVEQEAGACGLDIDFYAMDDLHASGGGVELMHWPTAFPVLPGFSPSRSATCTIWPTTRSPRSRIEANLPALLSACRVANLAAARRSDPRHALEQYPARLNCS